MPIFIFSLFSNKTNPSIRKRCLNVAVPQTGRMSGLGVRVTLPARSTRALCRPWSGCRHTVCSMVHMPLLWNPEKQIRWLLDDNLSRLTTKPTKWHVRPAKNQISLGIRPVWSERSLCAPWATKDPSFLHADSEDSDQTGLMHRLIWVFVWRTCYFVCFVMRRLK